MTKKFKKGEISEEELDREFLKIHDRLTALFYDHERMAPEEFGRLHSSTWLYLEKAKIAHGHREDFPVTPDVWGKMRSEEVDDMLMEAKITRKDWLRHGCPDPESFLPFPDIPD